MSINLKEVREKVVPGTLKDLMETWFGESTTVNPAEINQDDFVNVRTFQNNRVPELAKSFTEKGYLPESRVVLVRAGPETENPNLHKIVDGRHRVKAATIAKLPQISCVFLKPDCPKDVLFRLAVGRNDTADTHIQQHSMDAVIAFHHFSSAFQDQTGKSFFEISPSEIATVMGGQVAQLKSETQIRRVMAIAALPQNIYDDFLARDVAISSGSHFNFANLIDSGLLSTIQSWVSEQERRGTKDTQHWVSMLRYQIFQEMATEVVPLKTTQVSERLDQVWGVRYKKLMLIPEVDEELKPEEKTYDLGAIVHCITTGTCDGLSVKNIRCHFPPNEGDEDLHADWDEEDEKEQKRQDAIKAEQARLQAEQEEAERDVEKAPQTGSKIQIGEEVEEFSEGTEYIPGKKAQARPQKGQKRKQKTMADLASLETPPWHIFKTGLVTIRTKSPTFADAEALWKPMKDDWNPTTKVLYLAFNGLRGVKFAEGLKAQEVFQKWKEMIGRNKSALIQPYSPSGDKFLDVRRAQEAGFHKEAVISWIAKDSVSPNLRAWSSKRNQQDFIPFTTQDFSEILINQYHLSLDDKGGANYFFCGGNEDQVPQEVLVEMITRYTQTGDYVIDLAPPRSDAMRTACLLGRKYVALMTLAEVNEHPWIRSENEKWRKFATDMLGDKKPNWGKEVKQWSKYIGLKIAKALSLQPKLGEISDTESIGGDEDIERELREESIPVADIEIPRQTSAKKAKTHEGGPNLPSDIVDTVMRDVPSPEPVDLTTPTNPETQPTTIQRPKTPPPRPPPITITPRKTPPPQGSVDPKTGEVQTPTGSSSSAVPTTPTTPTKRKTAPPSPQTTPTKSKKKEPYQDEEGRWVYCGAKARIGETVEALVERIDDRNRKGAAAAHEVVRQKKAEAAKKSGPQ